jgi:hypothetical protein
MSVLDSIREALGGASADPENDVRHQCRFSDREFETAYSICPDRGSERITEIA